MHISKTRGSRVGIRHPMECQGTESVRSLRKGIPNLDASEVLAPRHGQHSSSTMAEPHMLGSCRRSQILISLLQNERGERQGTSPLRPEKNKKRSAETLETSAPSHPLFKEHPEESDAVLQPDPPPVLEHGRGKLPFHAYLWVVSPVLYHSPPGASLHSF